MAYIAPNSDVYILKGVPLDRSYNHTLLQTSANIQFNTFHSYRKYSLTQQSYQRAGRGKIRVGLLADNLYDCNYLMFRNTAYGNKWFYAFIDSIEYINDNATEINYTIDVMQTWYFDYELGECYVEREHTLTDRIGENLVPENLDVGDLIPENTWEFVYPDSIVRPEANGIMYELVILYVPNNTKNMLNTYDEATKTFTYIPVKTDGVNRNGGIVNGIYMGCSWYGIPMILWNETDAKNTRDHISNAIEAILGNEVGGSIVNIMQVPFNLWTDWLLNNGSTATRNSNQYMSQRFYNPTHDAYYEPKNRKMFTHPFKSIIVSNNAGQTASYKWEYFTAEQNSQKEATFKITGVPIMSPELMCYPHNYRGIDNDYENGLVLTDFPTPPWSEDSFTKWWTQNKTAYVTSLVSTAVLGIGGIIATVATGGGAALAAGATGLTASQAGAVVGGGLAVAGKIASSISQHATAMNTPDQISGQAAVSSLRTTQNRIGFKFYDMGVEKDKAKVIDNYFSMFGYAIKQTKIPNVRITNAKLRPHWNYIKTVACIIHAATDKGLPADDEDMIARIYDNGITFWTNATEVGNYSLDNSPVLI